MVSVIGFGSATLGNLYHPIETRAASETVDVAYRGGIRYFDTAPFYGFGLSERRLGDALRTRKDVQVSTKVGRLLLPDVAANLMTLRDGFASAMPFRAAYDYSYDGVMRSHEASLQRLGLARIHTLFVHDIGQLVHGDEHPHYWQQLTAGGGFRALEALRAEGTIDRFGLGVNEVAVCLDALREADLDVILLAGRYTLLEQAALDQFLPACLESNVSVIIGAPYNSGILVTGTKGADANYNYGRVPVEVLERVKRIEHIADTHAIPMAAAALQFPAAHPAVTCVLPGLASVEQVEQTLALSRVAIPDAFWEDMRDANLLRADAPTPGLGERLEAMR
jgi:D-threo-aldose 1-dehydrogenase